MQEENGNLQASVERREKEIQDLMVRISDTTKEYETKLQQKEEQILLINDRLSEGVSLFAELFTTDL